MEVPQHWRLNAQRYSLTGTVCENCGTAHFPPRAVCPNCAHAAEAELEPIPVPAVHKSGSNGNGRVVVRAVS